VWADTELDSGANTKYGTKSHTVAHTWANAESDTGAITESGTKFLTVVNTESDSGSDTVVMIAIISCNVDRANHRGLTTLVWAGCKNCAWCLHSAYMDSKDKKTSFRWPTKSLI
jgi:hypothetical protein